MFFRYSDPITKEQEHVFTLEFDEQGNGSASIETTVTEFVFSEFGIYRGMLFLEPGQKLQLKLPPLREKSFAEQKNPYFNPVSFWFLTETKQDLNNRISEFTRTSNQLTDKYFNQLYFQQSRTVFDSVSMAMNNKFPELSSETFKINKMLSIKMIEVEAFRLETEKYSELFSSIKPQFWNQPAFISIFEKAFDNQLGFKAKAIKGKAISDAVNRADIGFLINFVQDNYKIQGKTADLVLLKLLYDAYYSGYFSRASIMSMIKNERFSQNPDTIIKTASLEISRKFNYLQKGTAAPVICLNDLSGEKKCTDDNKEKFKYLIFADADMIVCREHMKYLSNIDERFQKYLEIYVILRNTDRNKIDTFFKENSVPGMKLVDENNAFISTYRIKSFPTCFLLDENHKVQITNTKAPLDGFEQQFGAFLQQELFQRQRNQSR